MQEMNTGTIQIPSYYPEKEYKMTSDSPHRETLSTETEQTEIERLRSENEALKIELNSCKARQKWEHLIVEIKNTVSKKELDLIGQDGWELASLLGKEGHSMHFIFKRPCG